METLQESKDRILKGKDVGIRFKCSKHWHMSMRSPCHKCVEEIGEEMPEPLPYQARDKKEFDDLIGMFNGKVRD